MNALATTDILAESRHVANMLERYSARILLSHAEIDQLAQACQLIEQCQQQCDAAVTAWRTALARRWECEIAGRRLYKQVQRQYREWYGAESLEIQRITSHSETGYASPADLLADLQRIQADLALRAGPDALTSYREDVAITARQLEAAILDAATSEATRRRAVLERRMAQEAFRRARIATQRALAEHGGTLPPELHHLLA